MSSVPGLSIGSYVRVRLHAGCAEPRLPHDHAEDGSPGKITDDRGHGDHRLFVLYKGLGASGEPHRTLGRFFRPDELEPIPSSIDPPISPHPGVHKSRP